MVAPTWIELLFITRPAPEEIETGQPARARELNCPGGVYRPLLLLLLLLPVGSFLFCCVFPIQTQEEKTHQSGDDDNSKIFNR